MSMSNALTCVMCVPHTHNTIGYSMLLNEESIHGIPPDDQRTFSSSGNFIIEDNLHCITFASHFTQHVTRVTHTERMKRADIQLIVNHLSITWLSLQTDWVELIEKLITSPSGQSDAHVLCDDQYKALPLNVAIVRVMKSLNIGIISLSARSREKIL